MIKTWQERPWTVIGLLLLVTFVTYLPALRGGFVFDDRPLIVENQMVHARDGLPRFWLTQEAPDYYPLTWSLWWLEWHWWGKSPLGYHAVNLLLHAANAVLVWLVLRRLRIPGAWLAALLFAVHPVNAVTVAWISEQKNTLSMLFFALAILWHLRFDDERRETWYGWSLVAFLLALLSKSAVVMLPAVLLGCVAWRRGRLESRDLWRVAPFFGLSLLLGLTTVWFQYHRVLTPQAVRLGGIFNRLTVAGWAPWFYLWKAILPLNLCLIYPPWNPVAWGWLGGLPGLALAGMFGLLWWKRNGWSRPWLVGLGYFVVMLVPVLGFFDQGFYQHSLVADHWQYYSTVGVTALAAAGLVTLAGHLAPGHRWVTGLLAGVVVAVLAALSWQRCSIFRNDETLFTDNLRHNPLAWGAHMSLGNALQKDGRIPEAIGQYEQALQIRPDYAEAHNNLGNALSLAGRYPAAIEQFQQALRIKPDSAEAHNNWGNALLQSGRIQDAVSQYEQALQIRPDDAQAHDNLGSILLRSGQTQAAMSHFEQALQSQPDDPEAHNNLAFALLQSGRTQEAIGHLEQALRIKPDYPEAHYDLGYALTQVGRIQEAVGHYEQALRIRPDYAEAHFNLGYTLLQLGKTQEAIGHFQQALRIKPDFAEARAALEHAQRPASDHGN
jgi:tetratricopeptide (TPR) repeat protein